MYSVAVLFLNADKEILKNTASIFSIYCISAKKSFYYYALFLAILNLCQTIGSSLLYTGTLNGLW